MRACRIALAILVIVAGSVDAIAQSFPARTVRVVVPFPAGGAVDSVARAIGQKLSEHWKQPVVVDNRAGAGGNIGADSVAKAAPDGYTLLVTTNGITISPSLYRKLPFDVARDFAPVTQLTGSYLVLTASPSFAGTSLRDLIDAARAKPGSISYGSTGVGVAPHLMTEVLMNQARIDLLHVPYKGDAQVTPALLSGEVIVAFMPTIAVVSHVRAGRLKALGVTPKSRIALLPDTPSIAEQGLPEFEYNGWLGLLAPARTPREIVAQIQRDTAAVLAMADVRERLPTWGYEPVGSTPEQFARRYAEDIDLFARIVRDARVPMQE